MTLLKFADAISLANITGGPFDGIAFYLPGGDAFRAWPLSEVHGITTRYRLPVFVRSNPSVSLIAGDVPACIAGLKACGAPRGTLVALDSETSADPAYVVPFVLALNVAGWKVTDYGSESTLRANLNPDGYYWGADWTSVPHLHSGEGITQYLSLQNEDLSLADSALPLWDARVPAPPQVPWPPPLVRQGASGGVVRTVQRLLQGRAGAVVKIDGQFGPGTTTAVEAVQLAAGIRVDGVVGPFTWAALAGWGVVA